MMKRGLCVACLFLATSCGSGVDQDLRSARESCRLLGFDDLTIDFAFRLARADRDAEFTEVESINDAMAGCRGDFGGGCPTNPNLDETFTLQDCVLNCSACMTAVFAEVYR